jgi:hypothetical protein
MNRPVSDTAISAGGFHDYFNDFYGLAGNYALHLAGPP